MFHFRGTNSIYGASMHSEQKPVEARPDFMQDDTPEPDIFKINSTQLFFK